MKDIELPLNTMAHSWGNTFYYDDNENLTETVSQKSSFISELREFQLPGFTGICMQCKFDVKKYTDRLLEVLLVEHSYTLSPKTTAKRKSEFIAGRYLAHLALLSLNAENLWVDVGVHREPIWPTGFRGSISHGDDFAVCIVSKSSSLMRVGIDVENYISADVSRDVSRLVMNSSELDFIGAATNPNVIVTIIFSAKESLFKALYPEVNQRFGFEAATVKTLNFEKGSFTLVLNRSLTPELFAGRCFDGVMLLDGLKVITAIYT